MLAELMALIVLLAGQSGATPVKLQEPANIENIEWPHAHCDVRYTAAGTNFVDLVAGISQWIILLHSGNGSARVCAAMSVAALAPEVAWKI